MTLPDQVLDFIASKKSGATESEIAAAFPKSSAARLDDVLVDLLIEGDLMATYKPGTTTAEQYSVPHYGRRRRRM